MTRRSVVGFAAALASSGCTAIAGDFAVGEGGEGGEDAGTSADAAAEAAPPRPYDGVIDSFGTDCTQCVLDVCNEAVDTCFANAACWDYVRCVVDMQPRIQLCDQLVPGGPSVAVPSVACVAGPCAERCRWRRQWSCAGEWALPVRDPSVPTAEYTVTYDDIVGGAPWAGYSVRACGPLDIDCATPVAGPEVLDAAGQATLTIPVPDLGPPTPVGGFIGYIDIGFDDPSFYDQLRFVDVPIVADTMKTGTFPNAASPAWMAQVGITTLPPPGQGLVSIEAGDCYNQVAPGLVYEVETADGPRSVVYFNDSLMVDSTLSQTGATSLAFLLAPRGSIEVIAKLADSMEVVARRRAIVRQDAVTVIELVPIPAGGLTY